MPVGGMSIGLVQKKDVMRASAMSRILVPVFPCVLKIMPSSVFDVKDPIVLDVHVVEGIAKVVL